MSVFKFWSCRAYRNMYDSTMCSLTRPALPARSTAFSPQRTQRTLGKQRTAGELRKLLSFSRSPEASSIVKRVRLLQLAASDSHERLSSASLRTSASSASTSSSGIPGRSQNDSTNLPTPNSGGSVVCSALHAFAPFPPRSGPYPLYDSITGAFTNFLLENSPTRSGEDPL